MKTLVGMDIGGTSIKMGLFTPDGTLQATGAMPTGELVGKAAFARVVDRLAELLQANGASAGEVMGVGLDVPGPVDAAGNVGMLPNLQLDAPGLKAAICEAFPQAKLAFANDANAAALGEQWKGAARGVPSFALVALGTGVGAGVVLDGQLVPGAFGAGGEFGHITVNRSEPLPCGCGKRGCLEQYASASGIVRCYRDECERRGIAPVALAGPTDTLAVFGACRAGDAAARAAVSRMCDALGFALAQVSVVVDPQAYFIGGGVGNGFDLFADELRASFGAYCLSTCTGAQILPAALGNDAALYGSAYLAR